MPRLPAAPGRLRRLVVLGIAAALVGCGGGDSPKAKPRAVATAFPPLLQTADCNQWRELRPASRVQLVEQMRLFFGARVDSQYGRGQTLTQPQAMAVLTNGCRPAYAGAVKLYKLYGRAAAFTP